ncbi:MAG TPA: exodeoxyribonuclease III [Candidatus Paceibacterota bacterium]|nr:exodeoxyribonuclease III [Candidatus Paceibacterota bacterium]
MKLISWNVNGIRSIHKKGTLSSLIEKVKPDFVCLQETKAEEHQSEIELPDYDEYWNASTARKGYSGTAIFCREQPESVTFNFPPEIAKKYKLEGDGYGDPNAEGRVVTVETEIFYLVNVYTPNSKPDLSRLTLRDKHWDPAFLEYCKELEKEKPVIFCGDLNVAHTEEDLANPEANDGEHGFTKEERAGIDKIIAAGFVDTFRHFTPKGKGHYTWWSHFSNARARNVGWRIDYFFVSKKLMPHVKKSTILADVTGSDHCPVLLELDI